MNISDRDRRIIMIIVPIVLLIAYYFLILAPKRDDLKTAGDEQQSAEAARDQAVAQAAQLERARQTFAEDYAAVVRLGKAIPEPVDSPSLLVQLDRASNGTHIDFGSINFGGRTSTTINTAAAPTQAPAQPNGNAATGGAPAATGLGRASESAGNAVNQGSQASTAAAGTDTTTSTTPPPTTPAPAPSTATTTTGAPAAGTASLDTVALTFNFTGSYFDLADFFHRLKRFVSASNKQIVVRGRLMTIDSLTFAPGTAASGATGGELTAAVGAAVYLSPKAQGATGGATAAGPGGSSTTTTTTPAGSQTSQVPLATAGVR